MSAFRQSALNAARRRRYIARPGLTIALWAAVVWVVIDLAIAVGSLVVGRPADAWRLAAVAITQSMVAAVAWLIRGMLDDAAQVAACEICGGEVTRRGDWDYCLKGHTYVGERVEDR